jgi:hypothetical protein
MKGQAGALMAAVGIFKLNSDKTSKKQTSLRALPAAVEVKRLTSGHEALTVTNDRDRLRAERELIFASL